MNLAFENLVVRLLLFIAGSMAAPNPTPDQRELWKQLEGRALAFLNDKNRRPPKP